MKKFFVDKLCVEIFPNRTEMGNTAAHDISEKIHDLLNEKEQINMIFGAAPSPEILSPEGLLVFRRLSGSVRLPVSPGIRLSSMWHLPVF